MCKAQFGQFPSPLSVSTHDKAYSDHRLTSQQLGSGFIYAYACCKVESYWPTPT